MLLHFVVISVFDRDNHRAAKLGPKDPDFAHQSVAEHFRLAGIKADKAQDHMWYLVSGNSFVGYVKVFRNEKFARSWFRDIKQREASDNFWAFWRDGKPLMWTEGANIQQANQFVNYQALCRVRAFSAESAAESGWKNWISDNLTAIEVDLEQSRGRAKDEKGKDQASVGQPSRQTMEPRKHSRKYQELARAFAIVIVAANVDDPVHSVMLLQLDEKGAIDFNHEEFVLAKTTTRDAALNYAMKLTNMLKLRVLEIAKT